MNYSKLIYTILLNFLYFYALQAFDWRYYAQCNKLSFSNEQEALQHYQSIGYFQKLSYCQKFTFAILLHLYDLTLIDEFIDRINTFIRLNDLNSYYININVPISTNISSFNEPVPVSLDINSIYNQMIAAAPYHPYLVTKDNCVKLYQITTYLKQYLNLPHDKIQVMFSENRGYDIGGFLLQLDQLITKKIKHDFIIKLYTETNNKERTLLTSFLNLSGINQLLRHKKAICPNIVTRKSDTLTKRLKQPYKRFNFYIGRMFLVSNKFTNFFKKHDLLKFFNLLTVDTERTLTSNNKYSYFVFEQFFGYLINHLKLPIQVIEHKAPIYPHDNLTTTEKGISLNYDINYIKECIKKHNIKIMALYFPQFHSIPENDRFWGQGFTEWTMMNRYTGPIKKPHVDIGQYNMLDYHVRKKQAQIAKDYGISAFCYYHYWFNDHKVMYKGIEKIFEDGEPNIPFTLCWANDPWTRNWDGLPNEVLIPQDYGTEQDWVNHYNYLAQFFKHPNYIKEDNCPILYIYRIEHMQKQDTLQMLSLWKELAKKDGFSGLKIISILGGSPYNDFSSEIKEYVDGYAEHQPTYILRKAYFDLLVDTFMNRLTHSFDALEVYRKIASIQKPTANYTRGIFYGWDHSSRRINKGCFKFTNLSYRAFEELITKTVENIAQAPDSPTNFILLNSWNEWTEQAMVEPNDYDGYRILEVIQKFFINL